MKEAFSEYYQPSDADFAVLWKAGIVAFDASSLLNLYFYSERTAQTFLAVMQLMKDRLWLPYQAGLEYQRNRLGVLTKVDKGYVEAKKAMNALRTQIHARTQPPFLGDDLAKQYDAITDKIIAAFDGARSTTRARSNSDTIRDQLDTLFAGRVGTSFTAKELATIFSEGRERYKVKTPPGFKDEKDKPGNDMFGDLVIWRELIEKSKADKKPMIFITDDGKEDWLLIHDDNTIGPRPELLKEFIQSTGQYCYIYSSENYLRYADKHLTKNIDSRSLLELREASLRDRLLTFEHGFEDMPIPTDSELDEASKRLNELACDSDEYYEALAHYNHLVGTKSADAFMKGFHPTLSLGVQRVRSDLTDAISTLLQSCRTCTTWDDRSEYKLPSWLEYVVEEMIPYTSLPKLRQIKLNLEELLRRHRDSTIK
jgi:hypothetical protein